MAKQRSNETEHPSEHEAEETNSYVVSIGSYGCESWIYNNKMPQKVDVLEME